MTIRAPLSVKVGPQPRPVDLLTWVSGVPPQPPPAVPFKQTDWPNPLIPRRAIDLLSWENGVLLSHLGDPLPPISSRETPNPVLARDSYINRGWIWTETQLIPPTPIQNRQADWPLPQPQKPNLELRTWLNQLPPGVVGNPVPPILNYDWPNPGQPRRLIDYTWTWAQQIPQPVFQMPFSQTDWPNPVIQRPNLELRTWTHSPAVPPFVQLPLNQHDWPNPILRTDYRQVLWIQVQYAAYIPPPVVVVTPIHMVNLGLSLSRLGGLGFR